jgi:hypothetical protein
MADIPFPTNLLPQYQSPQAMLAAGANLANTQANTQQTQAQTGLIGAQTTGADIANQGAGIKLGLLQNYLNGQSAPPNTQGGSDSSGDTVGGTNFSPDQVSSGIVSKFAPLPTARPPQVTAQMGQAAMAGLPEVAQNIGAQYDAKVALANQQRQLGASGVYQMAETVASAPAGAAFETFSRINPQAAAALKAAHPSDDPEQLDADARLLAQHTGIAVHQYTGRDTDFQNGVLVDKKDGKPVLGSEQVLTGLNGAEKGKVFADANELVTVHNSDGSDSQVPRWKVSGFNSAASYLIAADKAARSKADSDAASEGPPTPGNTATTVGAPKRTTTTPTDTTDPALREALNDPKYALKTPTVVAGRTPTPAELDQQKATQAARTDLLSNAQEATNSGAQALQYMRAARAIMESKGAPVTGPLGALVAKASSAFGGVDATNYQEVAKYLGNSAIQAGKQNFGKGMTQNDVTLQKDELSPSVHMTDDALKNLLDSGIRNTQYTMDSAKRVPQYLTHGRDPQQFAQWNDEHFSRSDAVNKQPEQPKQTSQPAAATEGAKSTSKSGKPIVFSNGHWQYQ